MLLTSLFRRFKNQPGSRNPNHSKGLTLPEPLAPPALSTGSFLLGLLRFLDPELRLKGIVFPG
jgi:hypothetical protein